MNRIEPSENSFNELFLAFFNLKSLIMNSTTDACFTQLMPVKFLKVLKLNFILILIVIM